MIDKAHSEDKGVKGEAGDERNAVMEGYVDERRLVLKLHKYKDMDYTWDAKEIRIKGDPLRKASFMDPGDVKFLLNDFCCYVDEFGLVRLVDLEEHDAYITNRATVSVNNKITTWE